MAFTKINAAGIGTTETVTVDGLTVINDGSFGGNLSVGGTITYEDVTNVDSVGIITARAGVLVGSGITLSKDGDGFFTGIVTATSFAGDGSALTGVASTDNIRTNTNATFLQNINVSGTSTVGGAGAFGGAVTISHSTPQFKSIDTDGSNDYSTFQNSSGQSVYNAVDNNTHGKHLFQTAGTERMRIDSSGRLLLGTTTEGSTYADEFTVATSANCGITIRSGTSNDGNIFFSDGTSGDDELRGYVQYSHANNFMRFATDATERLRITSSGQLFIGNGVTSSYDMVLLRNTDGNVVSQIVNTNTGSSVQSILQLQVGTDRYVNFNCNYTGQYMQLQGVNITTAYNDFNTHIFRANNGTEKARIDSSGKLNVGGTTGDAKLAVIDSSNPDIAMRYNGTSGGHKTRLMFMDKRGVINAQVANILHNDGVGTAAADLEFASSTGGTLTAHMILTKEGCLRKPTNPAFMARTSNNNFQIAYAGTHILYNVEIYDAGGNYNTSNGRFTAPVNGYYYLQHQLSMHNGNAGILEQKVYINGSERLRNYTDVRTGSGASSGSAHGIIYMTAGDYAQAYAHWSSSNLNNAVAQASSTLPISYFTGYLVS